MIKVVAKGNFDKTEKFLNKMIGMDMYSKLESYAKEGVDALRLATPKDSGKTAASWSYKVEIEKDRASITWTNDNLTSTGIPIAILLQYGHGLENGGFVKGRDYINPAMRPVFDRIADKVWKEVTNA